MEAEKVIYSYIKSRGLKSTEQAMRADLKNFLKYDITQTNSLDVCDSVLSQILLPLTDPFLYDSCSRTFLLYKTWVASSLDLYKPDLLKFASPFFIYMYLELLEKSTIQEALNFFNTSSDCLSKYDFSVLSSVRSPNDIKSAYVQSHYFFKIDETLVKYVISIRKSSLLLLMAFIEENQLTYLLHIINTHIEIILCLESSKDEPVILPDYESCNNKCFLMLNVQIDEDRRREVKVQLPLLNQTYLLERQAELENKTDLTSTLPYIICHNVKASSKAVECTCIDISEDGTLLFAGFEDSCIRYWNLNYSFDKYSALIGHSSSVLCVSLSPDKFMAVSSADDGSIRLWILSTKSCAAVYSFHSLPTWALKFSPTGHYFASGGMEAAVCLWSTEYTTPLKLLIGHISDIFCVQFHPRATFLASGSRDKTVRLWDSATGDCVRVFCGHKSPVLSICFNRLGKFLISGDDDGVVQNWDINEKEIVWERQLGQMVVAINISQENSFIAAAVESEGVVLLSNAGKVVKNFKAKGMNTFACSFTTRNLLCVAGSN